MPAKKKKGKAKKNSLAQSQHTDVSSKGGESSFSFWSVSEECEYYASLGEYVEILHT